MIEEICKLIENNTFSVDTRLNLYDKKEKEIFGSLADE